MGDGFYTGLFAVIIAAVNMIGSVLIQFIRARYGTTESHNNGKHGPDKPAQ